jgi:hypothetical protein
MDACFIAGCRLDWRALSGDGNANAVFYRCGLSAGSRTADPFVMFCPFFEKKKISLRGMSVSVSGTVPISTAKTIFIINITK